MGKQILPNLRSHPPLSAILPTFASLATLQTAILLLPLPRTRNYHVTPPPPGPSPIREILPLSPIAGPPRASTADLYHSLSRQLSIWHKKTTRVTVSIWKSFCERGRKNPPPPPNLQLKHRLCLQDLGETYISAVYQIFLDVPHH